jgi:transposase
LNFVLADGCGEAHVSAWHGGDDGAEPVLLASVRREKVLAFFAKLPPCVVGMEACATAHYRAREFRAVCTRFG